MAKHPPAETYDALIARLVREMPDATWLRPNDAADHLENLYPQTDPVYLTEQIRETALAILIQYPQEKSALSLLSVCNTALESGDYCQARIKAIKKAYAGIDISAWLQAKGGWERAKKFAAEKAKARKIANEILATRKGKPTTRGLWRLVALKLDPDLSGAELKLATDNLRNQNKDWKPSD